jgi:FtsH-binding integral membrane protein
MADEHVVTQGGFGTVTTEQARETAKVVFGQTMFLVAATMGFFAAGAYIGRDLSGGWSIACFIGAIVLMFALNLARKSPPLGMTVLFAMGTLMGLGLGPGLAAYASLEDGGTLLAQAGGATALFVGGLGSYGYATRRDFAAWGRYLFFALLGLIAVGLVFIFVSIPGERVVWSLLGLGVFGALTVFDFNRLKRASADDAVFIACSIFLDVVNIFLFMLQLLGGGRD